uniref:Lectin_legB domain-containing protein n=1 Tax=Brugia timori TaxID=42155 RepID=A0A0R3Q507_9BILA
MHITWAYLITLIILISDLFIRFTVDVVYADYKNSSFTDSGAFLIGTNKSNQIARIHYANSNAVYGITVYEKLLATALDNIIVVYNISSSVRIESVHSLQLPRSIRKKLLEFKFIGHEMQKSIMPYFRLCLLTSPEKSCMEYLLALNGNKVEELIYATAVKDSNENVNIRVVTKNANQ